MKLLSLIAAGAAALLAVTSLALATQGVPLSGIPVGLEGDPGGSLAASGKTDAKGSATLSGLKPGRYVVSVPDLSQAKGPVVIAVSVNGAPTVTSEPTKPGKGKAYAMDKAGRKLVFTVDKPGSPIVVTVSER